MNLSEEVDLEDYVSRPEKISGAEISCVVQEAGMQAVRNNRCARRTRRAHAARAQPRRGGSSEGGDVAGVMLRSQMGVGSARC